jgi:hypothetical protein
MQKITAMGGAMFLALGVASACGGEDDGGGAAPGWSIPDDAVLGTLTDAQKDTLCNETKANLMSSGLDKDSKEIGCRLQGFLAAVPLLTSAGDDAALQMACQAAYDPCMAMPSPTTCTPPTETCMATMAEYRACLDEGAGAADQGLMLLPPCPELTRLKALALAAGGTNQVPPLPACMAFQTKCPDVDLPTPDLP